MGNTKKSLDTSRVIGFRSPGRNFHTPPTTHSTPLLLAQFVRSLLYDGCACGSADRSGDHDENCQTANFIVPVVDNPAVWSRTSQPSTARHGDRSTMDTDKPTHVAAGLPKRPPFEGSVPENLVTIQVTQMDTSSR